MTQQRSAISSELKWDIEKMYPSQETLSEDYNLTRNLTKQLTAMQSTMTSSASSMAAAIQLYNRIFRLLAKIEAFASMNSDQDLRDSKATEEQDKATSFMSQISAELSWFRPEIMQMPTEVINKFLQEDDLKPYLRQFELLLREKNHILSPNEERILSLAEDPLSLSQEAYTKLANADFVFGNIESNGETIPVTHGSFIRILMTENRQARYDAFKLVYSKFNDHTHTLTALLNGQIKYRIMNAKVRNYESSILSSLFEENISIDVYDTLINAIHQSFPVFYKFVEVRKKVLMRRNELPPIGPQKINENVLNMYDVYLPLVPNCDKKIEYKEAQTIILEALAPLGEEYVSIVKRAFSERWIDLCETVGKKSGAYSGGCYDSYPYILTNYVDTIDSVFTLAHELGHSVHSYLSNAHQEFPINSYKTFVAEVASTVNEGLLWRYLVEKYADDKEMSIYLCNVKCDDFKTTVFRQTMFAEFEKKIHFLVENDQPLTPEIIKKEYYNLVKVYFGPLVEPDEDISMEWSRIPHFYLHFYVYKYATSFCGAEYICGQIYNKETREEMVKKYIHFLSSGQSKEPLELLKNLGVDMSKVDFITEAMKTFEGVVTKLGELLG